MVRHVFFLNYIVIILIVESGQKSLLSLRWDANKVEVEI